MAEKGPAIWKSENDRHEGQRSSRETLFFGRDGRCPPVPRRGPGPDPLDPTGRLSRACYSGAMDRSEEELAADLADALGALAAGDDSARDRIIEVCGERLRVVARRMLGRFPGVRRWDDTDDIFQNAVLRLYRALGEVRPDSPRGLLALAVTQLKRELIDLARRYAGPESHAANLETNMLPAIEAGGVAEQQVDRAVQPDSDSERWARFHEAIATLEPAEREVFELVWYAGVNQQTAADLLGCSVRTVKSRWRAARETVRLALEGQPPE
jgi:RNA polymerase sigma factor (sigma-70 family)